MGRGEEEEGVVGNAYFFKEIIFVVIGNIDKVGWWYGNGHALTEEDRILYTLVCVLPYYDHTDLENDILFHGGTLFSFDCTLVREYRMHIQKSNLGVLGSSIGKINSKYMPFFYSAVSDDWGEHPFPSERAVLYTKLQKIGSENFLW